MVHCIYRGVTGYYLIKSVIVFVLIKNVDPYEMPYYVAYYAAFHLGLLCLSKQALRSHKYTECYM